jgi:hypothetical protein
MRRAPALADAALGGRARVAGWRGLGWLGALLLCVVLASAGVAASGGTVGDRAHIESCHDRTGAALPHATARLAGTAPPGALAFATALPRPRPRARTIEAGGLPPPRAPTA